MVVNVWVSFLTSIINVHNLSPFFFKEIIVVDRIFYNSIVWHSGILFRVDGSAFWGERLVPVLVLPVVVVLLLLQERPQYSSSAHDVFCGRHLNEMNVWFPKIYDTETYYQYDDRPKPLQRSAGINGSYNVT